ncbi:M15 family metallopeptidase [Lysinibacillus sp. NPDC096418]|uniref:M15 family metallopeptidase n=1 Tax=Lysinibacillus sp. NPDC096418 TaxID=3364138 RepID=UPI0037F9C42F
MTSVTTTCRDLAELLPVAQQACRLLFQECYKAGIRNIFITETYRSQERQNYLYAQGRTRPGRIVTWTLNSNHKSRLAWDIAVGPPQSLYEVATLNRVGAIAKKLGIEWGGNWSNNIDRPHFEVKRDWKMPKGYMLGKVVVPSNSKLQIQLIVEDEEENVVMTQIKNWNPSSPAMHTATENIIKWGVEKKHIQAQHLTNLQNKELTTDRVLGLIATVIDRSGILK